MRLYHVRQKNFRRLLCQIWSLQSTLPSLHQRTFEILLYIGRVIKLIGYFKKICCCISFMEYMAEAITYQLFGILLTASCYLIHCLECPSPFDVSWLFKYGVLFICTAIWVLSDFLCPYQGMWAIWVNEASLLEGRQFNF